MSSYDYGQGDGYDELGRRTEVIRTGTAFNDQSPEDGFIDLFGYNDRSELTGTERYEWTDSGGTGNQLGTYGDFLYAYDHIGNRESYTLDQGTATTYTANDLNRYTATAYPTESFGYDDDGNLTADGVHAYAWDAENRLICVAPVSPVQGDGMLEFRYDYMGRRVRKVYSIYNGWVWNAERTEQYVYDGWNVVLVLDDANVTQRKYTWGLDLSGTLHGAGGIGGLLAVEETAEQGAPAYWFLYDANGNVGQAIKASDQSIAAKYEYDPYGNVISQPSPYDYDNPIRFSTKWFDTELAGAGANGAVGTSGLGYWGGRYYSARLGRWLSRDPKEERGGLALYQFARNAATFYIDPDGQQAISTSDMVSPGSQPSTQPSTQPPATQPPSTQPNPPPATPGGTIEIWCSAPGSSGSNAPLGKHCGVKCAEPGGTPVFCEGTGPNDGTNGPGGNGHPGFECFEMFYDFLSQANSSWTKVYTGTVPAGSCSCLKRKGMNLNAIPNKQYDYPSRSSCHSNSNAALTTVLSCCGVPVPSKPSGAIGWGCPVKRECCQTVKVPYTMIPGMEGRYYTISGKGSCPIGCADLTNQNDNRRPAP